LYYKIKIKDQYFFYYKVKIKYVFSRALIFVLIHLYRSELKNKFQNKNHVLAQATNLYGPFS